MTPYIVFHRERNKREIHTGGKAEYQTLPESVRSDIKRFCNFSRQGNCWVLKGTGKQAASGLTRALVEQHGYEDRGEISETLSFGEQWEQKQERAEARTERFAQYAENASSRAADHVQTFRTMRDAIPFGQPILVGHHSEKRDRNYRNRANSHIEKASEEHDKAQYFQQRADAARSVAEHRQLQSPVYLSHRIEECRAELREIERRGKKHAASHPGYGEKLNTWKAEVEERLAFFEQHRQNTGPLFTKESLQGKTEVKIKDRWHRLVRLNRTSVTVPNICFRDVESQERWGFQYKYAEISDAR